jgi:alpha-1,2-mannosyltransferase
MVFGVILLMPISHQVYVLLPLPALWWWIARATRSPRRILNWVVVAVLAGWWAICFRLAEFGLNERTAVATVVAVTTSTLLAAAASTIGAAVMSSRSQPAEESPGTWTSRTGGVARPATRSSSRRSR